MIPGFAFPTSCDIYYNADLGPANLSYQFVNPGFELKF